MKKKILLALLAILVLIQFFRPTRNLGEAGGARSIVTAGAVPPNVEAVLKKACYDCHSNHTEYPWYTNIQPVGWWMQHHVNEGKAELNFSEWAGYSLKKKIHKLEEVREEVEEAHMPISSYLLIHEDAKLSKEEERLLIEWARSLGQKLSQPATTVS